MTKLCHSVNIVFPLIQVEGQRQREVPANKAVHEKLTDIAMTQEHELGTCEHRSVGLAHLLYYATKSILSAGLILPEVHKVKRVDDKGHI